MLFIVLVLGPVACLATCRARDAHPSDEALIASLEANRQTYERLRGMLLSEAHLERISYDFALMGDGQPVDARDDAMASRLPEYRNLMRSLSLESGITVWGDEAVEFHNSSQGMVTSGSSKGLLAARGLPDDVRETEGRTEDACGVAPCTVARPVSPGWYILLSRH